MQRLSLKEMSSGLQRGDFSSQELTETLLQRISKAEPLLNSFITVTEEFALMEAATADRRIADGEAGPLTGVPYANKDIFCTEGVRTTCGSKMLDNFCSPYDATTVTRLRDAGMVMLGKTNMDEFAMGSSNESSFYEATRNPWNTDHVPGGSSGGSAAAVAAGLTPLATGTDTGGSIRQPAAFCGITGLKPTYGRVSRYGMIAFASSLDQGGPMACSAEDAAMALNVMAGFDPRDSTSSERPSENYLTSLNDAIDGLRIGLPREYFDKDLSNEIGLALENAIHELEKLGVKFTEISLPHTSLAVPAYYVLAPAECSSNLARYDGVRYGYRCKNPSDLNDLYTRSRSEGFGNEVKRRILIGTYALSSGYYDAYYVKAQKVRRLIGEDFNKTFAAVDLILTPVTPTVAFKLGEKIKDPVTMYKSDIYTIPVNLAGLPALSIPAGFSGGLPVGVQLIGNHFDEARLLTVAHAFQKQTDWHTHTPESRL